LPHTEPGGSFRAEAYPHHEPADEYLIRYGVPFVPRLIERAAGR